MQEQGRVESSLPEATISHLYFICLDLEKPPVNGVHAAVGKIARKFVPFEASIEKVKVAPDVLVV